MENLKVDLKISGIFSKLFLDYVTGKSELEKFVVGFPSVENIKKNISNFSFEYLDRKIISEELLRQNNSISISDLTKKNILSLADKNSFTVCTGHQLCLFTGPAYFIYKIISCIKTCELLNKEMPEKNFVPVYWMAGEDHDLEEIDHTFLFGKKIKWEITGKGRAGDLSLEGIEKAIEELNLILGQSENSDKIISLFEKSYLKNKNLAEAIRVLVNEIFGKHGLVILDGNSPALKDLFKTEMKNELLLSSSFKNVSESSLGLENLGYSSQVTPREINLFYAQKNSRERIVKEENVFKVLNTDKTFSEKEILEELEKNPSAFSPNVVLRPLYQQKILPNIIYCGGPGEIAYWLQYKKFFDESKIHFPFLLPRNFVLLLEKNVIEKWNSLGFSLEELFSEEDVLIKKFVKKQSGEISLEDKKKKLEEIFSEIEKEAAQTDKGLSTFVGAEKQKALNSLSVIESKLNKSLKQKNETGINQIVSVRAKVFPNGNFQERHENFFSFANKYGMNLIDEIKNQIPFSINENVISVLIVGK